MCNINNHRHDKLHNTHSHVVLADIRSTVQAEFFGDQSHIEDSYGVRQAKEKIGIEGATFDNLLALAKRLCEQLRYRDAIACCQRALEMQSNSYEARRLLAMRYLSTGQADKALKIFGSLQDESDDKLDIAYRIGLCHFYMADYVQAKENFCDTMAMCKDNHDMYIATLYWYICSIVRLHQDVQQALKELYFPIAINHHVGYDLAIRLFLGAVPKELEQDSQTDNLTRVMYLFGLYHYYLWKGEENLAKETFRRTLDCDEYWASFSGLGAWYLYKMQRNNLIAQID